MRSVYANIKSLLSLSPAVLTSNTNGAAIDTLGYNSAKLVVAAGALDGASTDETYVVSVEDSADGSTGWAAISGLTITLDKTTGDNTVPNLAIEGLNSSFTGVARRRYLRAVLTVGGTTPSAAISAVFELGRSFRAPVQ